MQEGYVFAHMSQVGFFLRGELMSLRHALFFPFPPVIFRSLSLLTVAINNDRYLGESLRESLRVSYAGVSFAASRFRIIAECREKKVIAVCILYIQCMEEERN